MASFGERLKRERELRRISLDQISEATKIGTRSLRALEEQEFEKLPGGIFNKGFVRSYARFLGIDEEQAVADYEAAASEKLAARGVKLPGPAGNGNPAGKSNGEEMSDQEASSGRSRKAGIIVVLVTTVACVLAYLAWKQYSAPVTPSAEQTPVPVEPVPLPPAPGADSAARDNSGSGESSQIASGEAMSPADSPAPAPETEPPSQPAAGPLIKGREFEVRIEAQQDSWVSITADGQNVIADILPASSEKTVRARREITLKVGNAGGVTVYHDGNQLPSLGEVNKTATLTVTPEGPQP